LACFIDDAHLFIKIVINFNLLNQKGTFLKYKVN
jgi:hypothetical protein